MILRLGLFSAAIYACLILLIEVSTFLTWRVIKVWGIGIWGIEMTKPFWFVCFGVLWAISFLIAWPLALRAFLRT
ncbi:MAG TPA: hypothetical protein VKB58_01480 [Terriglobales bacterium]|nr:hypothetical protein [Terriglobales bacterium]